MVKDVEEYVSRIRSRYSVMSESEKKIADYILSNDFVNEDSSINNLAAATGTSVSTVVRFCKTLGFKGYAEFKFYCQKGILSPLSGQIEISNHDSAGTIKQKVAEFSKNAINNSILYTDNQEIERAINALSRARQILVCGEGSASGIALLAVNTFMNLGIPSYTIQDPLAQIRTASFLGEQDVVIGITNCGYIKDVVDTLAVAKENGATTICITGLNDSLVTKYSDVCLCTTHRDNQSPLDLPTTTICQMITLHTLQIGYIVRNNADIEENVKNMHQVSELKRYDFAVGSISKERVKF